MSAADRTREELSKLYDRGILSGIEAQTSGRFGLALEHYYEALEHAEAAGSRGSAHQARINISSCYLSLREWTDARTGLPAIILESDQPARVSAAAAQLAEALMHEGKLEKAGHYAHMALQAARSCGDISREMSACTMQGHLAVMEGRHDDAVGHHTRALEVFAQIGGETSVDEGALRDRLGYAQLLAGQILPGIKSLRLAARSARRADNQHELAEAHVDLAFGFMLADKRSASERHAIHSLALAKTCGFPTILKNSTFILMELSLRSGREHDFDRWFDRLQELLPDVQLSRDFFPIFDISDVINLKEF
jgi:tetratricopeptide (TPR) repeat protein